MFWITIHGEKLKLATPRQYRHVLCDGWWKIALFQEIGSVGIVRNNSDTTLRSWFQKIDTDSPINTTLVINNYSSSPNGLYNNYSIRHCWIWSDKVTDERVARVGYNRFLSNKGEWNNCFSKFSNQVLPPIFISTILQSVRKEHTTSGHTRPDVRLPPSPNYYITKSEWKWQLRKRQSVFNLWRKPSSNDLTGEIQGKQTILEVFKCEESVQSLERFSIWRKTPTNCS